MPVHNDSTFSTRFPYYHSTLNQVICIYLLETFCFCYALADFIYFQHSRHGEIHRKRPVRFLQCFFGPDIKIGGPPADLLINQGVWDNVSGHTTRAPPGRVRTDNQIVVSHLLLELRDIGIENFQILSMLISYFAFTRTSWRFLLTSHDKRPEGKLLSFCLSANDYNAQYQCITRELVPFGTGSFADFVPVGTGSFSSLVPVGTG